MSQTEIQAVVIGYINDIRFEVLVFNLKIVPEPVGIADIVVGAFAIQVFSFDDGLCWLPLSQPIDKTVMLAFGPGVFLAIRVYDENPAGIRCNCQDWAKK
ncbi:MAG: hypothetical protein K1566_03745 [Candidatus Thiodiazotropha sp. (ex. Lucinisca nassula)]|nr:hypothetical protein [Candidatus Thiodiazotropha sp. (ex. Lucinisca nassula)]MBW9268735.1 hypothetical protein [Candidatus Thiodiazotropha sp. (ex. Lucinisca nassula)]